MNVISLILFFQIMIFGGANKYNSEWDSILKSNVDKSGLVNYSRIKNDARFNSVILKFENTKLDAMSKNEKLSFLINAYNAFVIKGVLMHKNMHSPLDDENFFKSKMFKIAGKAVSLDEIEHGHVLKIEPELPHFGLVCGAKSCPKLIPKAYTSANVINQLKINTNEFINNKAKNYLDRKTGIINLSQIFNWFKSYFGNSDESILEFIKLYINTEDKKFIESNKVSIKYLNYDWELNAQNLNFE